MERIRCSPPTGFCAVPATVIHPLRETRGSKQAARAARHVSLNTKNAHKSIVKRRHDTKQTEPTDTNQQIIPLLHYPERRKGRCNDQDVRNDGMEIKPIN